MFFLSGLTRAVCANCRIDPDDDLAGDVSLWLCELVAKHHTGDVRGLLFVSLCNRVRDARKKEARRARLAPIDRNTELSTLPQLRACPDPSLFWDDPEALRIILEARVGPVTNFSRKAYEARREKLKRLRLQHAPNS